MIDTALFDTEAEKAVVGSCVLAPERIGAVLAVAPVEAFTDPSARRAMEILERAVAIGLHADQIDVKLLAIEMRRAGDEVGRRAVEFLVDAGESVGTAVHAEFYADHVRSAWLKRRTAAMASTLDSYAQNGKTPAEIADWLTARTAELVAETEVRGDVWGDWRRGVEEFGRRTTFKVADHNSQFNRFGIGPKSLLIFGAPPGFGKTILAVQLALDAMAFDDALKVVIANVEMDPGTLLDRQLARLARVPYGVIRDRSYQGDRRQAVLEAADDLFALQPRLRFLHPPFTMARLRALSASLKADIVLVDYIQRFKVGGDREATDARQQVGDVMAAARELAMTGPAVIAISAMSRQGEFRESSELEYGADAAYILECEGDASGSTKQLVAKCKKNRHGPPEDVNFEINGTFQEATAEPEVQPWDI